MQIIILGCGYMMGAKRFQEVANDWGINVSEHEAQHAVNTYREKYYLIADLWKHLKQAAINTILTNK